VNFMPKEYEARWRHAGHYFLLLQKANKRYRRGGDNLREGLELFDTEWINIRAAIEWCVRQAPAGDVGTLFCNRYLESGANLLHLCTHPAEHIRWREAALNAARRLGDRAAEANHLGSLGLLHSALGHRERAIEIYRMALAVICESSDPAAQSFVLCNLGGCLTDAGEVEEAIRLLNQGLNIARDLNDRDGEAKALGNLANAYAVLGEMGKAGEYYLQQLKLVEELGDQLSKAVALCNVGLLLAELGQPSKSLEYYEEALGIFLGAGDLRHEQNVLCNAGISLMSTGEMRRACDAFDKSFIIAHETGDDRGQAFALFNSALALDNLGERAPAVGRAQEALGILEAIKDVNAEVVRAQLSEWGEAGDALAGRDSADGNEEQNTVPLRRD
jgi:tetratricopeptide (TPR) repeat protein